jgi:hypothetical protein
MHTPLHVNLPDDGEPPERFQRSGWGEGGDGGRISRGFDMLGRSWDYLSEYPRLVALPAIAAAATALAALLIFVPVLFLTDGWDGRLSMAAASTAAALPFTFISTFFNVGFLGMVASYRRGERPTVRDGLRFARARWRVIAGWALLTALVGSLIRSVEEIPGIGGWLARLVSWAGGLAWAMATFFVVPVLVTEDVGARAAVRRSSQVFRARWGEAVTGEVVIGAAFGIVMCPMIAVGMIGFAIYPDHVVIGASLLAVAIVCCGALIALSSAMSEFFTLALYEHALGGEPAAPFTQQDLSRAIQGRKPPFWRR